MADKEKINLLEVIPFRVDYISTRKEEGEVILSFLLFKKLGWIHRHLLPKFMSREICIRLEGHGTAVWEMIDGKRSVREIIEGLAEHFQNEPDYESRVTDYLTRLHEKGLIKWMTAV